MSIFRVQISWRVFLIISDPISDPIFGPFFMGPISGPIFMGSIPGPIYLVWARSYYPVWAGFPLYYFAISDY